ncbi:hypothetical protein DT075_35620 [Bacillus licheniformis]|nr:hypothetical protein DT075_35620 [Bacillus licheniformis]
MVAIVMTAASFMLPFCYKFKSNYLVIASIAAFGLYMLTINFFVQRLCVYLMLDISPIWVGVVFSIVISMYAFSIDEKSSIHMLLNSLPYTRKEIVSSKYIVVVLFTSMVAENQLMDLKH